MAITPKLTRRGKLYVYTLGEITGQGSTRQLAHAAYLNQLRASKVREVDNRVFYFTRFGPKQGWLCSVQGAVGLGISKDEAKAEALLALAAMILSGTQRAINPPPAMQTNVFYGETCRVVNSLFDTEGPTIEEAQAKWQETFNAELLHLEVPTNTRKDSQGHFILWTAEWNDQKTGTPQYVRSASWSLVSRMVHAQQRGVNRITPIEQDPQEPYPIEYSALAGKQSR